MKKPMSMIDKMLDGYEGISIAGRRRFLYSKCPSDFGLEESPFKEGEGCPRLSPEQFNCLDCWHRLYNINVGDLVEAARVLEELEKLVLDPTVKLKSKHTREILHLIDNSLLLKERDETGTKYKVSRRHYTSLYRLSKLLKEPEYETNTYDQE